MYRDSGSWQNTPAEGTQAAACFWVAKRPCVNEGGPQRPIPVAYRAIHPGALSWTSDEKSTRSPDPHKHQGRHGCGQTAPPILHVDGDSGHFPVVSIHTLIKNDQSSNFLI